MRKVIASDKHFISKSNIRCGFLQFQAFAVILPARENTARLFWEIMPHESLGEFLAELQDNGELLRISVQVDSALELAAIVERMCKESKNGGPALFFENVKNSSIPVVANLLGNERRLCRSLGVARLDEVSAILERSSDAERSGGWWDPFKSSSDMAGLGKWAPKTVKTAACQQVVRLGRDLDLWSLPVPRCWPDETHPVITSGLLVTSHQASGKNVSYRSPLAVTNQQELAWYIDNADQKEIVRRAIESKQNLPVAITLGGDPVLAFSTIFPGNVDSRSLIGLLRGKSLELARCRTNELEVPAGAELVIEGYIDATNAWSSDEISIARGNGRYVQGRLPLIQVTAVTHRANPVFPATIPALPPSEETWLGLAAERLLLPHVRRLLPEIVDIHQPVSSASRNILFVSIQKTADHQGRRVLHALWGMESIGQSKIIVIVNHEVDIRCEEQVWLTVGTHACPNRDFVFSDGLARDDDYTPLTATLASRVGIDATRKQHHETNQPWPESLKTSNEIAARISERWAEYGINERIKA